MSTIEESIEVNVPLQTAYNQWTQFEEFPQFMEGVEEIRQLDDTHLHWKTRIGGIEREFDAEVTEQTPDERIAWRATSGTTHAGVVTFHRIDDSTTRIMLQLDSEPEGIVEKAGDALGILKRRVKGDMERFKALIESRGTETGAWRGDVDAPGTSASGEGRFSAPNQGATGGLGAPTGGSSTSGS
ncbi:MAG TPA: SRPBCC family protein [Solirubrobacteraceae bacterium]|nr:SRPBCC family protein [Solirubrobacteraceae bacterium]